MRAMRYEISNNHVLYIGVRGFIGAFPCRIAPAARR